jgi:hypothetical protein
MLNTLVAFSTLDDSYNAYQPDPATSTISFIPIVNIVIHIIVALDVAKRFGKGGAFGFFLLFLLSFIGYPIIGFGKAQYTAAPRGLVG